MIVALIFIGIGLLLLGLGMSVLRGIRRGDWLRDGRTVLSIGPPPGEEAPRAMLQHGEVTLFAGAPARWNGRMAAAALGNPEEEAGRLGGQAANGRYGVARAVDLAGPDPLGLGSQALDGTIRAIFGRSALILTPGAQGLPILLHGHVGRRGDGSPGNIAIHQSRLDALLDLSGDPRGLTVELRRRNIRRSGWGVRRRASRRIGARRKAAR